MYCSVSVWSYCTYEVLQAAVEESEAVVQEHSQYEDAYQAARDWLTLAHQRLELCSQPTGDKHALINKRDRAQVCTKKIYHPRWYIH